MNPHKIMTFTETVSRARRSNTDNRLANLQAVTNAARRAHKNVSANEAIALYCGVHFRNLPTCRAARQGLDRQVQTKKSFSKKRSAQRTATIN